MSQKTFIEVGSTVKLLSGGPVMTVSEVSSATGIAQCVWFVDGVVLRDTFNKRMLSCGCCDCPVTDIRTEEVSA